MSEQKKIEDYLHLYLGCEVEPNFTRQRKLVGFLHNSDGRVPMLMDFNDTYERIGQPYPVKYSEIKPLLRPLSDMTDDEARIFSKTMEVRPATHVHRISVSHWTAKTFHYLLKQGFDLFGLIDAGLAIDKSKQ